MNILNALHHLVEILSQIILVGVIPLVLALSGLVRLLCFLRRLVREDLGHALKSLIDEMGLTFAPLVRAIRERVSRKKHRPDGSA